MISMVFKKEEHRAVKVIAIISLILIVISGFVFFVVLIPT